MSSPAGRTAWSPCPLARDPACPVGTSVHLEGRSPGRGRGGPVDGRRGGPGPACRGWPRCMVLGSYPPGPSGLEAGGEGEEEKREMLSLIIISIHHHTAKLLPYTALLQHLDSTVMKTCTISGQKEAGEEYKMKNSNDTPHVLNSITALCLVCIITGHSNNLKKISIFKIHVKLYVALLKCGKKERKGGREGSRGDKGELRREG